MPSNLIKKDKWLNSQPEYCIVSSYVNISRGHLYTKLRGRWFQTPYSANQYIFMLCNSYYSLGFMHNCIYLTEQSMAFRYFILYRVDVFIFKFGHKKYGSTISKITYTMQSNYASLLQYQVPCRPILR